MSEAPTQDTPLVRVDAKAFINTGLLWFVNRMLHAFGFAIAYDEDEATGAVEGFYVCRTSFRGYEPEIEDEGYERVARYMRDKASELYAEGEYDEPPTEVVDSITFSS